MGKNPSHFSSCGSNCPVEKVSWYDAVAYANALSDKEGLTRCYGGSDDNIRWNKSCNGYRLPTEAEWEYAARGVQSTKGWGYVPRYSGSSDANTVAWYGDNSGRRTHPVGQKKANAWGLYDMSGNVREWTWDWYGSYSGDATDPPDQAQAPIVSSAAAAGTTRPGTCVLRIVTASRQALIDRGWRIRDGGLVDGE